MPKASPVFEKTYTHYLNQVAKIDLPLLAPQLGAEVAENRLVIALFGRRYTIGPQGIAGPSGDRPSFDTCVVLFKYILLCPQTQPQESDWSSFRDLKDSGPLTKYFAQEVEHLVATHFAGRTASLKAAAEKLGGKPFHADLSYDVSIRIEPLARVPLLLLFNDEDEEFPVQCSVLFEQRAEAYLDAECLAILGGMLAGYLKKEDALLST